MTTLLVCQGEPTLIGFKMSIPETSLVHAGPRDVCFLPAFGAEVHGAADISRVPNFNRYEGGILNGA